MKLKSYILATLSAILLMFIVACSSDDSDVDPNNPSSGNFDRTAMLAHWADNIIIPSYQDFTQKTNALKLASDNFIAQTTPENLNSLRAAWEDAYLSWQSVEMYNNFGPASDLFLGLYINIYPSNTSSIDNLIANGNYNLIDPNLNDEQGFPALDYLLFGLADTDAGILQLFDNDFNGDKYRNYLNDLVTRIDFLGNEVLNAWQSEYRDIFVQNSGSSANSSLSVIGNSYLKYYEVFFRNGKIGIPAGILSSGNVAPEKVEAPFKGTLSKALALEALSAFQGFFNGSGTLSAQTGPGFKTYLDFLDTMKGGENLSTLINEQFEETRQAINNLDDSFANQINTNNDLMLTVFEEMQDNVIYLKSDMFSALSITLNFESGDGD